MIAFIEQIWSYIFILNDSDSDIHIEMSHIQISSPIHFAHYEYVVLHKRILKIVVSGVKLKLGLFIFLLHKEDFRNRNKNDLPQNSIHIHKYHVVLNVKKMLNQSNIE